MGRKAYAVAYEGRAALVFKSKALRDFFVEKVAGAEPCSCDEYRRIERKAKPVYDKWGNELFIEDQCCVYDMSVGEYWEDDWDFWSEAIEAGLI